MKYTDMDDQQILKELGMDTANQDLQETTLAAFWSTVNMRVMMGLGNSLRDDELDDIKDALDSNDTTSIVSKLDNLIPNAEDWLNGILAQIIHEIKADR